MRARAERPTGAVVTGASSGIGRATALRLAGEGMHVVLTGRAPEVLEQLAQECRDAGGTASVETLDVRDEGAVDRVVSDAADRHGRDLAVVHAAAVVAYGLVEEVPADLMSGVVATNVSGTIAVCRAALRAFRRTGGGHLVVVGSLLGEVAEDVAARVVWVLRRPRRTTHVGPANPVVVAGFRLFPAVYDAVATPALRTFALDPWRGLAPTRGNVDHAQHPAPPADGATPGIHTARDRLTEEDDMSEDHALTRPRASRSVAAPAEAVWAVLADGWQYATWVVGASRVRDVDHGWPAAGTRLHHSFGPWPAVISDATVSEEAQEPHHLVLTAKGWPMGEARVEIAIVPDGPESCTVSIAEDATAGPGRLLPMPLRQVMILPRNREALRRLAFIAEGRHRDWLAGSEG